MSEKTRKFLEKYGKFLWSEDAGKSWKSTQQQTVDMGNQVTDSIGHRKNPKTGHYEGGGPFYTVLVRRSFPTTHVELKGQFKATANDRLSADVGTPMPTLIIPSQYKGSSVQPEVWRPKDLSDLHPLGATAISEVAPTNPNAEAATMLGEAVKDGFPAVPGIRTWKSRTLALRNIGDEFLNVEFGWLPLVSDVTGVSSSIRNAHTVLQQYERDSGRNVRREFAFPVEHSERVIMTSGAPTAHPFGATGWPVCQGYMQGTDIELKIEESSKKWFSGCFTYTTPPRTDSRGKLEYANDQAHHLLGTHLTPDVLWELTPWSWAIDWFSNTGDVISNFTNFALQGLVMRYGYMMHEKRTVITATFAPPSGSEWNVHRSCPPQTYEICSKVRGEASPFGFGVSWEGLSPTQLAITAALGITRLRL